VLRKAINLSPGRQRDLLETYLEDILNPRQELVQMGKRIDWTACERPVVHHQSKSHAIAVVATSVETLFNVLVCFR
jgi:hypothetical protein|tara:strand:+ start:803 stop:1030 length:228 start_codon:yes stop_codon:yes gene_type:complete